MRLQEDRSGQNKPSTERNTHWVSFYLIFEDQCSERWAKKAHLWQIIGAVAPPTYTCVEVNHTSVCLPDTTAASSQHHSTVNQQKKQEVAAG